MRVSQGENEGEQSLVRKIEMFVISGVRNIESSLYNFWENLRYEMAHMPAASNQLKCLDRFTCLELIGSTMTRQQMSYLLAGVPPGTDWIK